MERFLQDVRFAARSLVRNPGFTITALLTLALGLGANTAMFSIVNGVLLRPLPYPEPDRLVRVYQANPGQGLRQNAISAADFEDWRTQTRSFAGMAAYMRLPMVLGGVGDPIEIQSAFVTGSFFAVLGSPVQLGRTLADEDVRQANAVISNRLWRTRFGADPQIVGKPITLPRGPLTIVGVMPSTFRFPTPGTDVWVPESLLGNAVPPPSVREARIFEGIARLKENVSLQQTHADLNMVAARLAADYPQSNAGWSAATVVPLRTAIVGDVDRALFVVLGVVGFILLIACANMANLLLARGAGWANQIAIRAALGAGRMRIIRQLLTESFLLSLLGGVLGLVLAVWGVQAIMALSAKTLPRVEDVHVDGRVLGFGLLLALATGLMFGLIPALRAALAEPQNNLKGLRGSVGHGQRLRSAFVVVEVSLAVVLVIGAGLMARSFLALRSVDPGFDAAHVLAVTIQYNMSGIAGPNFVTHLSQRRSEIIERVAALPGVVSVGAINSLPLQEERWEPFEFTRADGSGLENGAKLQADRSYVSSDYLQTMKIPVLRGELLPEQWAENSPIPFLINEAAARNFWPGKEAVGQVVRDGSGEAIVVGVVGDVRQRGLAENPRPTVYFPHAIAPRIVTTFVVRTVGNPLTLADPVRQIIRKLDRNQAVRAVATMSGVMSESIARDRFFTIIFGIFSMLALVLAAVGVYGVLAYSVSQRTQEIGLRMAFGARGVDVLRLIVVGGMRLVLAGVVLGTFSSLLITRVLKSQLYGISTTDPSAFVVALAVLLVVALLACYIPARRAMRLDPSAALRVE